MKASRTRPISQRRKLLRGLVYQAEGSALIEFVVFMPLVIFMFLAVVDYSLVMQRSMMVTDAATVGARYAAVAGNGIDTAGMITAAQTTAAGVSGFTATATNYCTCSPGGTAVSCSASCASSLYPAEYAQVKTSATVPLIFGVSGLPSSIPLSATSTMRIVWGQ